MNLDEIIYCWRYSKDLVMHALACLFLGNSARVSAKMCLTTFCCQSDLFLAFKDELDVVQRLFSSAGVDAGLQQSGQPKITALLASAPAPAPGGGGGGGGVSSLRRAVSASSRRKVRKTK